MDRPERLSGQEYFEDHPPQGCAGWTFESLTPAGKQHMHEAAAEHYIDELEAYATHLERELDNESAEHQEAMNRASVD